ncbi:MAG: oligopeptide-binding protein oppA, partial [Chlamydiota bacterium]
MFERIVLFTLAFLVASCGKSSLPTTSENVMRISLKIDPTSPDPRRNGDVNTSTLNFLLYEGLTRLAADGVVEMALAETVDISSDKKTYTFHLRKAHWSDGAPITAYDFEHSWKKTLDPAFGAACPYLFYSIQGSIEAMEKKIDPVEVGVKAIDASTLRVNLNHPTPYFLSLISFCNFYPIPKHIE